MTARGATRPSSILLPLARNITTHTLFHPFRLRTFSWLTLGLSFGYHHLPSFGLLNSFRSLALFTVLDLSRPLIYRHSLVPGITCSLRTSWRRLSSWLASPRSERSMSLRYTLLSLQIQIASSPKCKRGCYQRRCRRELPIQYWLYVHLSRIGQCYSNPRS